MIEWDSLTVKSIFDFLRKLGQENIKQIPTSVKPESWVHSDLLSFYIVFISLQYFVIKNKIKE